MLNHKLLFVSFITLICYSCECPQSSVPPEMDSSAFVEVTDVIMDAMYDIRYYSTYNFVGERIDGYEAPIALLTRQAADSLLQVSEEMRKLGYRLKIYDGYRPQCAVAHFVRWAQDTADVKMKAYFYPELDKSVLIPDYICDQSSHTRGSTVDLTLFDMATQKDIDMGCTFDYFGVASHPDVLPGQPVGDYTPINEEQYQHRQLLREAMLRHGFKPFDSEWWHFTLVNEPFPDTYFQFPVRKL